MKWQVEEIAPLDRQVLCYWRGSPMPFEVAQKSSTSRAWFMSDSEGVIKPTHWMPIPEPPK